MASPSPSPSPSPQPFVLLAPFETTPEDNWFRTAYKYDRAKVFEWMETKATTEKLKSIYHHIKDLSLPNGKLYKDATKLPVSHIARLLNDSFKTGVNPPKDSKFFVNPLTIEESTDASAGTDASASKQPDWWCPYDLLGLFLSLLGPAPAAANKNNFYLPLTAVYARWCSRIAGYPEKKWPWKPADQGEGFWPFVYQCTWHTTADENTKQHWGHYFLGATIGGDRFNKNITGLWKDKVLEARFNMLFACQKVSMVEKDWFKERKAPNQKAGGSQVPFGNCGETYPFAIRFSGDTEQNASSMRGLALRKLFMQKEEYPEYNEFNDGEIWENLMDPCPNCQLLISKAMAKESNFASDLDKNEAPEKPKPK